MIRPTLPEDTTTLLDLAQATGVFKPHEIDALGEVLADFHELNHEYGHQAATLLAEGEIVGFVYFAPTAMTDRTWEIWWIAIHPSKQGQGYGRRLLEHAEDQARRAAARILLIETSSTDLYIPTRDFYLHSGYEPVATIPNYYADGDGKTIFAKRISQINC